jgi:hypothetical protein
VTVTDRSLATAVSAGFTVLALSKYAAIFTASDSHGGDYEDLLASGM